MRVVDELRSVKSYMGKGPEKPPLTLSEDLFLRALVPNSACLKVFTANKSVIGLRTGLTGGVLSTTGR